jgi:hypothetical protein
MVAPPARRQAGSLRLFISAKAPGLWLAAALPATILLLVLARLLPPHGLTLALRMGVAVWLVLLLPGALIARALGWADHPAMVVATVIPWSLVAIFVSLMVTFATHGPLSLTIALLAVVSSAALIPAGLAERPPTPSRTVYLVSLALIAAGLLFGTAIWFNAPPVVGGDALEHLARARKLAELPVLGLGVTELFKGARLHPGYAFPLWHGVLALIARLAGVDPAAVVRWLPALLAPLVFLVTYAAGTALFRTPATGVAAVAGQLAFFGLVGGHTGGLQLLSQPHQVTIILLVPSLLALLFTYVETGRRSLIASVAAAALSIAVVHSSYGLFVCIPVMGFLIARFLLCPRDRTEHSRIAAGLAAMAIPIGAYFLWLVPSAVRATLSFQPGSAEVAREIAHYGHQIQMVGRSFRLAPLTITAAGPAAVAALLVIPCTALAIRARWVAFALGGGLAVLIILLVPPLFQEFTSVVSISQGRRFALFFPWSFEVAGGALLLGRLRLAGTLGALGAGFALQHFYPGDFTYASRLGGGPAWPVWLAAAGGGAALLAGIAFRHWSPEDTPVHWWAAATGLAFIVPLAIAGFADMQVPRERVPLTPGLITALRTDVGAGDVVFALPRTSYMIVAYAPVYVADVPVGHAWDRPEERVRDAGEFFSRETLLGDQQRILAKYKAQWLVVDARHPPAHVDSLAAGRVYADRRYALYRLGPI